VTIHLGLAFLLGLEVIVTPSFTIPFPQIHYFILFYFYSYTISVFYNDRELKLGNHRYWDRARVHAQMLGKDNENNKNLVKVYKKKKEIKGFFFS
jgi:hypothetical protein